MAEIYGATSTNRETKPTIPKPTTPTAEKKRRKKNEDDRSRGRGRGAVRSAPPGWTPQETTPTTPTTPIFRRPTVVPTGWGGVSGSTGSTPNVATRTPAYGGAYNPTVASSIRDRLVSAFQSAFGTRSAAYGGSYNPTTGVPSGWNNPFRNRSGSWAGTPFNYGTRPYLQDNSAVPNIPTYTPAATVTNRSVSGGRGTMLPNRTPSVSGADFGQGVAGGRGTMLPYYGTVPLTEGTGGGGYGGGGYGGGGGGRSYNNTGSTYDQWLQSLLARWSFG